MFFDFKDKDDVSIPRSEFCPLGRIAVPGLLFEILSFNSSVGILSIGTYMQLNMHRILSVFQFLGRNSVHWDFFFGVYFIRFLF